MPTPAGYAEYTFGYGEPGGGWIPLVGDWDGDGTGRRGPLQSPELHLLPDQHAARPASPSTRSATASPTPAGRRWSATGTATAQPAWDSTIRTTSTFYLTNTLQTGFAEHTFGYGEPNAGWKPLVGDWNGDGTTGVGLFAPKASTFYLTNAFVSGFAQYTFGYGEPNAGWKPLVGDWNGNGAAGVGLYAPSSSTFYLTDTLTSGYAEYTVGFGQTGHDYDGFSRFLDPDVHRRGGVDRRQHRQRVGALGQGRGSDRPVRTRGAATQPGAVIGAVIRGDAAHPTGGSTKPRPAAAGCRASPRRRSAART